MFNLPELLRTIAEDYGDRGCEITYDGTKHVTFQGQPVALKRTFENLVDNAVQGLALQLRIAVISESMGNHDSGDHGWRVLRSRRRWSFGPRRCGM